MIKTIKQFYKYHNLNAIDATWHFFIHIVGAIGIIYFLFNLIDIWHAFPTLCVLDLAFYLGITAGAHRLWSHRSYQATWILRLFLMLTNSGMFQGPIFQWSKYHRVHHKYSDTDLDPHSIKKGFFFAHVGWLLKNQTQQVSNQAQKIDVSDLINDSIVMFQKKYYFTLAYFMTFGFPSNSFLFMRYLVIVLSLKISVLSSFFASVLLYCWTLNGTYCVNSVCHMFGSRPWNKTIEPRDNYFVSIITHGQGYHNWHHQYPKDWRASKNKWYMINLTTYFIQLMGTIGLAKVNELQLVKLKE